MREGRDISHSSMCFFGRSWAREVLSFTSVKRVDLQGCPEHLGKEAARSGNTMSCVALYFMDAA